MGTDRPPTKAPDTVIPHPVLPAYYADEAHRRAFVGKIFDETSVDYDRMERIMGLGTGPWYRHQALLRAGLAPGMRVCDVGVGTGLVSREAAKIVGDPTLVTGVDPSAGMMANAIVPEGVQLLNGTAEQLLLPDASVDFLSMGFALRHLSSLHAAFSEFQRVLKPGGRVCILELTRPSGRFAHWALSLYMNRLLPTVGRMLGRHRRTPEMWRYYWDTIDACVPPETVMQTLRDVGFEAVDRYVEISLFSEYTATKPRALP
ncbi:MAG: class I SAM-dependent methyltransferase [Burkholderiales bacterium]|nr:class I SAM-dependent methyltransferase [Burkholderiales bacterium]